MAYSIQALGPHGPGYRLAGLPVSCRQLEADAGTIHLAVNMTVKILTKHTTTTKRVKQRH